MKDLLSRRMRSGITALACMALLTAVIRGGAYAQNLFTEEGGTIYSGVSAAQAGMKLGGWGSGLCAETTTSAYGGSYSLKITPKDLYAGGRLDFAKPIDLTKEFKTSGMFLQLTCRFGAAQEVYDPWAVSLTAPTTTETATTARQVKNLRVMLALEGGQTLECQVPLSSFKLSEDGWMKVAVPITAFKVSPGLTEYKLKRLVITGNGTDPFYVGEVTTVRDSTALEADAGEEMEVAKNYYIVFHGFGRGGATPLKYSWDFNQSDGIQEEAVGDLVYHRFSKAGNYVVTFTVADYFGLKKASTAIINVKVNE